MNILNFQTKKALRAILFILLLCLAGITEMFAYDFSAVCATGQTLYYNIIDADNHHVALICPGEENSNGWTGFTKPSGNIVLSASVQYDGVNYTVISIGNYAFFNCSGLTGSLSIPNSVTFIGNRAFMRCSGFTGNLTIPDSVTMIDEYAFGNCSSFAGSLSIGNSVTTIGSSAFSGCSGFTGALVIPNSVTTIGSWAFSGCSGFTNTLTIPNSVNSIGAYAFSNCSGLTGSLTIPNTVTTISNGTFSGCSGFTGSLTIPDSVTTIGMYAFDSCNGLTGDLVIPNSVTTISNGAFNHCSGFTGNLFISNSVTIIGNGAFSSCSGFTGSLTIPDSVTMIDQYAFDGCSGFSGSLTIGNSVTTISICAFRGCNGFTGNLILGNSVTMIGGSAFSGCSGFTGSLTIPSSVTSISYRAFLNCSGFTEVHYNATDCIDLLYDSQPFSGCSGILVIGDNVERIPAYMFNNCSGFTGVLTIPNSVTSIGNYAFSGCSGFTGALVIPNSVISLGNYVFNNCSGLTGNLIVPNSVTYIGANPFIMCSGLEHIEVALGNLVYDSRNNCNAIIKTSTNELVSGCMNSFIPNSVTSIGNYAFYYCTSLASLNVLAETPPSVGTNAFSGVNLNIPVTVPCGTFEAYHGASGWNQFTNIQEPCPYVISATVNPNEGGVVLGTGLFVGGDICTLIATPNEGFSFCSWTEDDSIVSCSPTYMFTVNGDRNLVANFGNCPSICNVIFDLYDSYGDGWNGASLTVAFSDGTPTQYLTINNGASAMYTIEVGYGVHISLTWNSGSWDSEVSFVIRYDDGTIIFQQGSNPLSGPLYEFDCTCPFHYYYNILTMSNPQVGGVLIGDGYYEEGDTCTLVATPNEGYLFDNWTNQGNIVSDSTTYSFIVTENATYVANFVEKPVLDTTIYIDICHGEDYIENGFEIIQPEVGIGNYSIVFHPAFNYDSIVNLALTVHPTYYIVEDTALCEMTPFYWHGNTYTESGIYYDTLQTTHGCDSIYALSLEFFNTPLGEFTYMTPTNNYPFTSLPITFNWDAVSGAEYYNFYLWNVNEPVPSSPYAGNIYNRSCYVPALQNHQTYNWYVEAVNTCFSTTSSVRSFSLNIPPAMNVSASNLNFGEVALNNSNTLNLYVSGNALDDTITMQISGEDASMFSFEQGANWNGLTGGLLSVTFSPTTVKYNYTANLVITTGTLAQTVQLTGSLADMFVFNTYVTQDVFEMNSTVPIYGTVVDANNNPASSAEVEVKVTVMNMTRSLFATTGADGHFSVDFVPAYSESGYYTINSGRVGHNSTAVHDDFNIPGMNLVTNDWILWDVVQNETATGSIVIRNRSQIPLNDIQVTATTLPEGCSFTFQPLSLAGMEEGVLEYSVSGITPTNGYQEVALVATSSEGATMNFTVWYRCAEPRGILYAAPNNITTTMTKGINKIVDVMLYNNGTGPTGSVYLDLPSVDWLSVVGNDTLPSIAVQDSAYFSLRLSANENTPLVQYTGNLAVNCERGDGLLLPYTIMAVSDSTGTLVVDVTDDYTYNGNGQHLQGATVTVKGYYSLETVAIGLTDSNGLFTVSDIPEGYYRMSITVPHHAEYQATIQIEGGQTNTQNIYLQYQAITYSWNVVPTEIQDEYTFELIVEYETNVPVPVVVIDMPQSFPELAEGESFVFDYIITNYGLVDTYDATLYPPTNHPLYDFTPLITEIDTLHAQTSVVIPCTMTVRTGQRSQAVIEALGDSGNREGTDCPYSALTKTKQYYICGDQQNWFWANAWRNIGSTPCQTAPSTVTSGGGGGPGGGGYGGGGGASSSSSSTPAVTVQNNDCAPPPCLPGIQNDLDNCPDSGGGTPPALPPQSSANKK